MKENGVTKSGLILALGLFGAIFLPACLSTASLAQTPVSFTTVDKGFHSGIREPLQVIIREREEWTTFWGRHSANRYKPSPPPNIDFSAEMVAAIFVGPKSTGGYSVEITRAALDGSNLRFYYRERNPPPGAMVPQVLTQPYHLVKLSRSQAVPVFTKESP